VRADRLVSLVLLLRQRGRLSATALSRELGVSTRTVLRDIEALSGAGVPVYAERGRHGGFALLPGFRTELTGLTADEALALLVAGSRRGAQAFGLGSALASAMLKVLDALPESYRDSAAGVAERLLIDPETDLLSRRLIAEEVPDSVLTAVRRAVFAGHKLRIHYAAVGQTPKWRTVDPIGLVTVLLVAFAVGLVVLATVLALRAGTRRRVVGITGAVLTVLGFCAGEFVVSFDLSGTDAIGSPRVVAVSADGAFELTVQPYGGWWVVYDVVQLRTRDGLRSRQSDRFVGCFAYHDDVQPEEVFSGARFTGPGEIEVSMQSGHTWTTTFDAATLRPAGQIMYGCEDAGSDAFTPR
jgi:biotin operon repressor